MLENLTDNRITKPKYTKILAELVAYTTKTDGTRKLNSAVLFSKSVLCFPAFQMNRNLQLSSSISHKDISALTLQKIKSISKHKFPETAIIRNSNFYVNLSLFREKQVYLLVIVFEMHKMIRVFFKCFPQHI